MLSRTTVLMVAFLALAVGGCVRQIDIHVTKNGKGEYYFYFTGNTGWFSHKDRPIRLKCLRALSLVDNNSKEPVWRQSVAAGSRCRDVREIKFGEALPGYSNEVLAKTLSSGLEYRVQFSASGRFGELVFTV